MKYLSTAGLMLIVSLSGAAVAQAHDTDMANGKPMNPSTMKDMEKCSQMHDKHMNMDMKGMDMKDMGMKGKDMKDMDMKDMDTKKCNDMMKGMHKEKSGAKGESHFADGVVTAVASDGKVTLKHGPVKTLGWPAMTMAFSVKDQALRDKLAVGKAVHVTFDKEASDYVITDVK
jgi:Cu(I)/Ag(I) efflux system protein CusF